MKRVFLVGAGFAALLLGVVGTVLPLLPTTPLVLLAALCFSRSSRRLERWLCRNRVFGAFIENYRTGRGISRAHRVGSIAFLWFGLVTSAVVVGFGWVWLILGVVGVAVTIHLLLIRGQSD